MREIKFRAWDKQEKLMAYNVERIYDCDTLYPCRSFGEVLDDKERFIPMQFTGLKDKNGKEIYEDDLVEYDDGKFKVFWYSLGLWSITALMQNTGIDSSDVVVIGNHYENPELLEDKDAMYVSGRGWNL